MLKKFLSKIKAILNKKTVPVTVTPKKASKKTTKSKSTKTSKATKSKKTKKEDIKLIDGLKALPGVGAKSAKALFEAGFKSSKDIINAKDEDLLSVPGVGINLVKKLRSQK